MALSTYLTFDGNCAEAFDFYKSVFGGEFAVKSTFGEGPADMDVKEEDKDRIMHVSLPVGGSVLMGSDHVIFDGAPLKQGNNFSISYSPADRAGADAAFAKLKDGGVEIMAMQDTFWGAYFGMCKDRFGVQWMINVDTRNQSA